MIQAVSGGGGGGGFDPSSISGLIANWDASVASSVLDSSGNPITADSTQVATWQDVSGSGFHLTQATSGNQPVWRSGANGQGGLPLLYFNAANANFLQSSANLNVNDCSVIAMYTLEIPSKASASPFWVGNNTAYRNRIYGRIGSNDPSRPNNASLITWFGVATSDRKMVLSNSMFAAGFAQSGTNVEFLDSRFSIKNDSKTLNTSPLSTTAGIYVGSNPLAHTSYACQMKIGQMLVYNRQLSQSEYDYVLSGLNTKWSCPSNPDTEFDRNSLLLNMQGTAGGTTFIDESPNAFTVTPYGNAQLVSDATFGTVASFDGNGDYLLAPSSTQFNFGYGDFTVEFWTFPTSGQISTYNPCFYSQNAYDSLAWSANNAGMRIHFGNAIFGGSSFTQINFSTPIPTGQWSHVAVSRSGNTIRVFINGTQVGSATYTGVIGSNTARPGLSLSDSGISGGREFITGLIGPVRITKGVARYTANFTPPTGLFPTS